MASDARHRGWLRISLRTFLLGITLVAVWLGIPARRVQQQRAAVKAIEALGGRVSYDVAPSRSERRRRNLEAKEAIRARRRPPTYSDRPWAPQWLVDRFGIDWFANVTYADLSTTLCTDEDLQVLALLPDLERLGLSHVPYVTDNGLANLKGLKRLRAVSLFGNELTIAGRQAGLTDDALGHLSQLQNLRILSLGNNRFTDEGLKHLAGLKQLRELHLPGTNVTVEGLAVLADLPALEYLHVPHDLAKEDVLRVPNLSPSLRVSQ